MDWQERALQIGETPDFVHKILKSEGYDVTRAQVRGFFKNPSIEFLDKREPTDEDVDAYIATIKELQKKREKLDTKQVSATIKLKDDKPIGIAFWGDWHEGAVGIDYDGLDEDTEIIANTDGLYWGGMGDYKDNYTTYTHAGAQYEQIVQPGIQDKIVERRMQKVAHNNLWLIRGCHDDWDKKTSDKDFIESLCQTTGGVNLWHGGDVFIELGNQRYHIKARHKYPFESGLNVENSMRRIFDQQGEYDIAMSAHRHNPFFMVRTLGGSERILGRSGSYKKWDEYSQKLAGYKGVRNVPVVILWPNEKRMHVSYLHNAIIMLDALRR